MIARLLQWIAQALGDGESPSSARLIAVPTLLAVYLVPLFLWAFLSLKGGVLVDFPATVIGFIGTVSGPLLVFIHWNKREETKVALAPSNP